MVWGGDIHVPVQALYDEVSLHLNEFIERVLVSDQLLDVLNGWLVHILFVSFAS